MSRFRTALPLMLLLIFSAFLFLVNLGGYDLWPPDEPRFAQVAREMMQSGDYLTPRVNGRPYQEKPPLMFWLTAAASAPGGDVTEWTARLPSVLGGLITLLFTYLLASSLFGRRTAFLAGLVLVTTNRFWWQARVGQLDMLLTACMTIALYSLWRWHRERRPGNVFALFGAMSAGLLIKGPPALVFPLLAVYSFYWGRKGDRKALHPVLVALAACAVALLWLVPARLGVSVETSTAVGEGIASNLFRQTIGRFFLGVNHVQGPWYYIFQLPIDLIPWALFLPWVLPWVWKRRKSSEEMRFLWSWTFPAFVFFSICIGKRAIYLLPLHPAIAILFAVALLDLLDGAQARTFRVAGGLWGAALLLLGFAPFLLRFTEYEDMWSPPLLLVTGTAVAAGGTVLWCAWRKPADRFPWMFGGGFGAMAVCVALIVLPAVNHHKSAKDFCAPLREMAEAGIGYDLYSLMFSREEYIYYARHFHQPVPDHFNENDLGLPTESVEQALEMQRLLRQLQRAVRDVPVRSMAALRQEERQALEEAMEETAGSIRAQNGGEYADIEHLFSGFFEALMEPAPAFVIVQEIDWRWILPLFKEAERLHMLHQERVGSRDMLLLANDQGWSLVQERLAKGAHLGIGSTDL